jgi:hypothetical protein
LRNLEIIKIVKIKFLNINIQMGAENEKEMRPPSIKTAAV